MGGDEDVLRSKLIAVLELSQSATFHWHAPTQRFDCDGRMGHLLGVPTSAPLDRAGFLRHLESGGDDRIARLWQACEERAVPFTIDVRVPDVGAAERWIGIYAHSHVCVPAGPRCIVGACKDVTARHRVIDADEVRRVADAVPQLVWIATADGRLEFTNDRWREYTGHVPHPDRVTRLLDAFVEEDRARIQERWLSTVRSGHELELEARLASHDGKAHWFLLRAVPMHGAGGVIVRWAGTCTDIDAQKRAELDAAAARDARDRAIATLGHELRTPLTTITMTLDLLRARGPTTERECSSISRQVNRMSRMVEDMLDLARVARGRVTLQRRPANVSTLLADAVEICSPQLRERAHAVLSAIDPHLIVDGEPDRLLQVFINLISNAAKYTPRNGHITVRAGRWEDDIFVEVCDDGIGIAPELQPHVFDAYVQGETSSGRAGGLGLGLSIAKAMVELHGGTISVASEGRDRGTTFLVRLPASTIAPLRRGAVFAEKPTGQRRRVLVVDDSPDVTEMVSDLLRLEGHEVFVAHDPRSALELAVTAAPEVALIDYRMPEMDGATLARELAVRLGDACPRLIAVSGLDSPVDRDQAGGIFERWLTKPFDVHLVRAVVAGAPRRRRRRRASSRPKRGA